MRQKKSMCRLLFLTKCFVFPVILGFLSVQGQDLKITPSFENAIVIAQELVDQKDLFKPTPALKNLLDGGLLMVRTQVKGLDPQNQEKFEAGVRALSQSRYQQSFSCNYIGRVDVQNPNLPYLWHFFHCVAKLFDDVRGVSENCPRHTRVFDQVALMLSLNFIPFVFFSDDGLMPIADFNNLISYRIIPIGFPLVTMDFDGEKNNSVLKFMEHDISHMLFCLEETIQNCYFYHLAYPFLEMVYKTWGSLSNMLRLNPPPNRDLYNLIVFDLFHEHGYRTITMQSRNNVSDIYAVSDDFESNFRQVIAWYKRKFFEDLMEIKNQIFGLGLVLPPNPKDNLRIDVPKSLSDRACRRVNLSEQHEKSLFYQRLKGRERALQDLNVPFHIWTEDALFNDAGMVTVFNQIIDQFADYVLLHRDNPNYQ